MVFIDGTSRDVRPPTGAAGGGGEKSLAAPSHSGIIAHSFARTHDTCTKTKPKSISRLGSLKDSPPNLQCMYVYTYKTTLRVIRRLWGGGGSTFRSIGPQSDLTSNSHCNHIESASVSHQHRRHTHTHALSHRYRINITSV